LVGSHAAHVHVPHTHKKTHRHTHTTYTHAHTYTQERERERHTVLEHQRQGECCTGGQPCRTHTHTRTHTQERERETYCSRTPETGGVLHWWAAMPHTFMNHT